MKKYIQKTTNEAKINKNNKFIHVILVVGTPFLLFSPY